MYIELGNQLNNYNFSPLGVRSEENAILNFETYIKNLYVQAILIEKVILSQLTKLRNIKSQ
jgi:hypothetical protein